MSGVCQRCSSRAVVRNYATHCQEEGGHDELLCLACGYSVMLTPPKRRYELNPFTRVRGKAPREKKGA